MKKLYKNKLWIIIIAALCVLGLSVGAGALFFNEKIKEEKTEKIIPVAMAADNNYVYPTLVSITSLMTNAKNTTHYDIYIMTQGDFAEENKEKLLTLQEKFNNKCKINLIDMQDRYKDAYDEGHITTPAYYRLSLSSVIPDEMNKAIWVDGDTLIFEDLTKLLDIDMENFYYKGFLDYNVDGLEEFGIEDDHYICSGVLLVNLKKLRQDNMEPKFEKFIAENNDRLRQHDQTVINVMCYENTGVLPAKYGIFNFANVEHAKEHASILKAKNRYTAKEMQEAFEHPAILHCIWKPWWKEGAHNQDLWLEYAAKTDYFDEIKAYYGIGRVS